MQLKLLLKGQKKAKTILFGKKEKAQYKNTRPAAKQNGVFFKGQKMTRIICFASIVYLKIRFFLEIEYHKNSNFPFAAGLQIITEKDSKKIICTSFSNGRKHDFRLFKPQLRINQ